MVICKVTSTARAEMSCYITRTEFCQKKERKLKFLTLNPNESHKIELCAKFQLDRLCLSWISCQTAVKTANNSCQTAVSKYETLEF